MNKIILRLLGIFLSLFVGLLIGGYYVKSYNFSIESATICSLIIFAIGIGIMNLFKDAKGRQHE